MDGNLSLNYGFTWRPCRGALDRAASKAENKGGAAMPLVTTNITQTGGGVAGLTFGLDDQTWTVMQNVAVSSLSGRGVDMIHVGDTLLNLGAVIGEYISGVGVTGADATITNGLNGTIEGSSGILGGQGVEGLYVNNAGTIDGFFDDGVVFGGGYGKLVNSGQVTGAFAGVDVLNVTDDNVRIYNNGTINGQFGIYSDATKPDLSLSDGITYIYNAGTISGRGTSIGIWAGYAEIHNSGVLMGDVEDSSDSNAMYNSGVVHGDVYLNGGNDFYQGAGAGSVSGAVHGGDGNDVLLGSGAEDRLGGDAGNDGIMGGGGDDLLSGGDGNDVILGGAGDDLIGGDAGNDSVAGGAGDDLIAGGAGRDVLRGGSGADTFAYFNVTDSQNAGPGHAGMDIILDFHSSEHDVLDVSAIDANATLAGDQPFTFIGNHSFSHTAGELRYATVANGNAFVFGDVDGDGVADFSVQLLHVSSMSAGDFVL